MKKLTTIIIAVLVLATFTGCKKGEKVEPTYFAEAEFKGFQNDKAQMHIIGKITGSPHASASDGETLSCTVPDDLKSSMTVIDSKWQISFHYYKRAVGKDKYSDARVLKKN